MKTVIETRVVTWQLTWQRAVAAGCVCCACAALGGCVSAKGEDPLGDTSLVGGKSLASNDYIFPVAGTSGGSGVVQDMTAGTSAAGIGGAAGTVALPPAGTGSVGGAAASAGTAGASGAAGTGSAGTAAASGAAGSAGTAGVSGVAGTGSAGMAEAGAAGTSISTSSGPGTLTVSVMSKANGGRYAPRNCGAIWIETSSGQFVKTIERWAQTRAADLRTWNGASGGWGFSFFGVSASPDAVDAVSAATLPNHVMHTPGWAMKDVAGMVVPDGSYKVRLEVVDGSSGTAEVSFEKGPMAQTVTASGGSGYATFTVTYTP